MLKNTELFHFWVFQSHMKYSVWFAGADLRQKCSLFYFTETWILVFIYILKWTLGGYLPHCYTINYDKTKNWYKTIFRLHFGPFHILVTKLMAHPVDPSRITTFKLGIKDRNKWSNILITPFYWLTANGWYDKYKI